MFEIKIRVLIGMMIFLGYFLIYVVRYNISVHIVDMAQIRSRDIIAMKCNMNNITGIARIRCGSYKGFRNNPFPASSSAHLLSLHQCVYQVEPSWPSELQHTNLRNLVSRLMDWDDVKIGKLFSAYHIGYCICFPIFHNTGDRLGPTWVVGIAGITSGFLNCLTPASAYYDFWAIFAIRVCIGFCAGAMQPSMVQVLRHWVPPIERNHFMWVYCGYTLGTFSTLIYCAVVQYYSPWPLGFYIAGGVQILWASLWVVIVTDDPSQHSFISQEEVLYLTNTVGTLLTIKFMNTRAPWKMILRSVSFWAICVLNFGYAWMIISLCLYGPLYYARVAEYSIYTASILTAVPFLLRLVLGTIVMQMFHWYKQHNKLSPARLQYIRKYFVVVSHVIPGVLVSAFWVTRLVPGPIILTLAVALTAAGMDLTLDLCYEITPNFANSVHTIIKIIGNTPGIIVSFCVGAVTHKYHNSPHVWKHIWCFHALVLLLSGIVFLMWGETGVQPWNTIIRSRPIFRKFHALPRPSIMSNITEIDEEDSPRNSKQSNNTANKLFSSFVTQTRRGNKNQGGSI